MILEHPQVLATRIRAALATLVTLKQTAAQILRNVARLVSLAIAQTLLSRMILEFAPGPFVYPAISAQLLQTAAKHLLKSAALLPLTASAQKVLSRTTQAHVLGLSAGQILLAGAVLRSAL